MLYSILSGVSSFTQVGNQFCNHRCNLVVLKKILDDIFYLKVPNIETFLLKMISETFEFLWSEGINVKSFISI